MSSCARGGTGHVNEYPTMHCFGNPRHTQSMIAYMILTEYFWKSRYKFALWEYCYHALFQIEIFISDRKL